jgi:hypothetical protein
MKFVDVMNTMNDKVEKMIVVIEIVLMFNMVFHSLMLLIVFVKTDILGCHSTIILGITKLILLVTVMLTVLTYSLKVYLILIFT